MHALEKRIDALEARQAPDTRMTIVVKYVSPGHLDDEITALQDSNGQRWCRQIGEAEEPFIQRATDEAHRNEWGVATLTTFR